MIGTILNIILLATAINLSPITNEEKVCVDTSQTKRVADIACYSHEIEILDRGQDINSWYPTFNTDEMISIFVAKQREEQLKGCTEAQQ